MDGSMGLPAGVDPRTVAVVVTLPPKPGVGGCHAYSSSHSNTRDGMGAAVGSSALSDYGPI